MALGGVFHIRQRLTPKGGNSFYRARRPAASILTVCGAPVTGYDVGWGDRRRPLPDWDTQDGRHMTLCPACRTMGAGR